MNVFIFVFFLSYIFYVYSLSLKSKLCEDKKEFNECFVDNFNKNEKLEVSCTLPYIYHKLIILPNERLILGNQLDLFNCSFTNLYLNNFKGIQIDDVNLNFSFYRAVFYNSDFLFYFNMSQEFKQRFFIRENFESVEFLKDVRYFPNTPIAVFKEATLSYLKFSDLVKSKIKKNYFTFSKSHSNTPTLNSKIKKLDLEVYNIDLNNNMIDEQVFESMQALYITNLPDRIEPQTFKQFKCLKELHLTLYSFKKFFHQGTEWMNNLNNFVKVNFTNFTHKDMNEKKAFVIIFNPVVFENEIIDSQLYKFPDEDFCLFKDFPHENYVYPNIYDCFYNSCTYNWLHQYRGYFNDLINGHYLNCKFIPNNRCDYQIMKNKCHKKIPNNDTIKPVINSEFDYYYFYNRNYLIERYDFLIAIVLTPAVCLLGILFNILNIIILSNKRYKKELKNRMYKQMILNSYINLLICLIYLTRLAIKCIDPIGGYCIVSIVTNKFYRYFFLTLVNYFGNLLKTCSNLIQISISLDRFILSTDSRTKFLLVFIKIDLRLFLLLVLLFSSLLNVVKLFEYDYEIDYTQLKYPLIATDYFNFDYIYSYFNILNVIVLNFGLIAIQIIIDYCLLRFLKTSFEAKNLLLININNKLNYLKTGRNFRKMIIFNNLFQIIFHLPDLIVSIFMGTTDFNLFKLANFYVQNFDLFSFLLNDLSDIIYIFSFCVDFFLLYHFNAKFRGSFNSLFK
jgi:hypothetical protein